MYFVVRAKTPGKRHAPRGKKVAVITLCVPSKESLKIIEAQLKSMSHISYPHVSWILDEDNSKQVKVLAKKYNVKHFSRKGISKYNQEYPPFKAKTKAGNVNAWLDHVKRYNYEYFVQLDIDHLAKPEYLDKTLGYFRLKKIAWVQAPSVYANRDHWTARGAAEQELVLQGPLQMGFYGHSNTPFIIGSHCTYRMSAVREIGGFQPTRAEDHLDTVVLASHGYEGVFLPEIIAEGDGPVSLNIYLGQQYAWAYSMFQVLTRHSASLLKTMTNKKRLQFLFAQTWYPFWSISYCILFFSPIVALLADRDIANVGRLGIVFHFVPLYLGTFLAWWAGRPLMQPGQLRLSWRGILLHAVRWPIVFKAVIGSGLKITKPYMITPKGKHKLSMAGLATYRPFLVLGAISCLAALFASIVYGNAAPIGQIIFALINAGFMLAICFVDIVIFVYRAMYKLKQPLVRLWPTWYRSAGATALLAILVIGTLFTSPPVSQKLVYAFSTRQIQPPTTYTRNVPITSLSLNQLIHQISLQPATTTPLPSLGFYNPKGPVAAKQPYIAQSFMGWYNYDYIASQLLIDLQNHDVPLLSIDPSGDSNGVRLLQNIASGADNSILNELAQILSAAKQPVYVRFAHEMDLPNLYPWANQNPALFIAAYRHVVTYIRQHGATNVKWVWSPAGNSNAAAYYPGSNYVDIVGTTILYDQFWYGNYEPTFYQIASPRMWLEQYGKPVWIVEFGVGKANRTFQRELIADALKNYQNLGFSALLYLNMIDANEAGPNYLLTSPSEFSPIFYNTLLPASTLITYGARNLYPSKITTNTRFTDFRLITLKPILNRYSAAEMLSKQHHTVKNERVVRVAGV